MSSSSPRHNNIHQKSHNITTSDSSSATQSSAVAVAVAAVATSLSPTKSSFRLTSSTPTAEAIPVGGDAEERLLKKEFSRRRQECSVISVIMATMVVCLVLAWVYYSSWFTFEETQRFQVKHRDGLINAVTREWIVAIDGTWTEPPKDTTEAPAPNIVLESTSTSSATNSHETLSASTTTATTKDEEDESSFKNPPASSSSSQE